VNKNEKEELMYDVAVAMLKQMSPGSVFQFAIDRQLQLMELYDEDKLKKMLKQYSPKQKKKSGGGF
jgi:hypothetical protein